MAVLCAGVHSLKIADF